MILLKTNHEGEDNIKILSSLPSSLLRDEYRNVKSSHKEQRSISEWERSSKYLNIHTQNAGLNVSHEIYKFYTTHLSSSLLYYSNSPHTANKQKK